jgi:hypothetical protein
VPVLSTGPGGHGEGAKVTIRNISGRLSKFIFVSLEVSVLKTLKEV